MLRFGRKRSRSDRSMSSSDNNDTPDNSFRAGTPVSDEDSETDQSESNDRAEAIRDLKSYLANCEMFYTFKKFLKTEGEGKKKVHTGLAKCMQPGCKNKGVTYTSVSRAHLRQHCQTTHPGKKDQLSAVLARNSRRGSKCSPQKLQPSVEEYLGGEFSQDEAKQIFTCFRASRPVSDEDSKTDQSKSSDAVYQDRADAISDLKSYLANCEMFYTFKKFLKTEGEGKKKVHTGLAKCMQPGCKNRGVTYTSVSRAHLRQHFQTTHPEKKDQLSAVLARNSRRGSKCPPQKLQPSVEEYLGDEFSQDEAKQIFKCWFVESLSPLGLREHPYTGEMFAYHSPAFQLMSRGTLGMTLDELMDKAMLEVNNLLSKQNWVATTADSWMVHSRAFLGMTVHWIDRPSLKRKNATLACREVSQANQLLREVIHDIHTEFGIVTKVVAITTDNGSNYVTAFNIFGELEEKEGVQKEAQEEEEEVLLGQPGDVQVQLDSGDIYVNPRIALPPHRRCITHTLNLLATTDIGEVMGWSKGNTPWRKATAKAQHLWNLQNQNPVAASQIREAVKRELTTPVGDGCNSFFNSVNVLLEVMSLPEQLEAINNIIIHQPTGKAGAAILDQDIKVLTEYRDVMKPVVATLDSLQREDTAYMGILLPTLLVLKRWLLQQQQSGEMQFAEPLIQSLLRSFDKRFGSLFEDQDLLMASALHPSFTPAILEKIVPDQADAIEGRILRELKAMVPPKEQHATQCNRTSHQDMVFMELFGADEGVMSQDVGQELRASIQDWKPKRKALSWELFPMQHREAWVDLFIKYNTPLPSSAAVERMFTTSGDILRPKRAALDSTDFEKLVFLQGNMSLLGYPTYNGQFAQVKQEEEQ